MKPVAEFGYADVCLTCLRLRICLKQGDALLPLLFNFTWKYTARMLQVNQHGLKLNGIHQLLVYADVVII